MDRNVYICQNIMTGQSYHLNGYVKVTYILDFGKKIRRGKNSIDTNIDSVVMRAE